MKHHFLQHRFGELTFWIDVIDIKLVAVVQRWIKEHQYGTSIWLSVFAIQ